MKKQTFVMLVAAILMVLSPAVALANNDADCPTHDGLNFGIISGLIAISIVAIATGGVVPAVSIGVGVGAPVLGMIMDALHCAD